MKLKLIDKRKEIDDVFGFEFQPEKPLSWEAGQYALYKIPHNHPDNRGETRIFTISSPPYRKKIMLTTKYLFQESSSFKRALFAKKVGEFVELLQVRGRFTVQNENQKMVFIAGGIGITPFHAILLELENKGGIKDIILIYSNKNPDSVVFKDALDRLAKEYDGFKIHYIYSPTHCDQELIKELVPEIQEQIYYLSGPTRMVDSVDGALQQLKVVKGSIRKDYIPGTAE